MRVLCVGDSLTAGFRNGGSKLDPYSAALAKLLGSGHEVKEDSTCGETAVNLARQTFGSKRMPPAPGSVDYYTKAVGPASTRVEERLEMN